MVDYSKWDKFASELSDDEDEGRGPVQVHHVEDGGSVTIGPNGASLAARSAHSESAVVENDKAISTVTV